MATTTNVTKTVTVRGTSSGLDEIAAKLNKVKTAQEGVAASSEKTSRATLSLQNRVNGIQRSLDADFRARQDLVRLERDLDRARGQGLLTMARQNELIALQVQRNQQAAVSNANLSSSYGRLGAAVGALSPVLGRLGTVGAALGVAGGGAFGVVAAGLAGLVGLSAGIIKAGDAWTGYTNRLKTAGEASETLVQRTAELADLAVRSRSELGTTIQLYSSLRKSTVELGVSQKEVARATETINKAFVLNGVSTLSAAGAILQLNQAFASGVLRGDELNSVLEGAPPIARLIAKEFNVGIGQLRGLAEQGILTTDRVFKAISDGAKEIDTAFNNTQLTVGGAFTNLTTRLIEFGAQVNQSTGLSTTFANILNLMASGAGAFADDIRRVREEAEKARSGFAGVPQTAATNVSRQLAQSGVQSALVPNPNARSLSGVSDLDDPALYRATAEEMQKLTAASEALATAQRQLTAAQQAMVTDGLEPVMKATIEAFMAHEKRLEQYERLAQMGVEQATVNQLVAASHEILRVALERSNPEIEKQATETNKVLAAQAREIAQIQRETSAIGLSARERAGLNARIQAENVLRERNINLTDESSEKILENAQRIGELTHDYDEATSALQRLNDANEDAIEGQEAQLRMLEAQREALSMTSEEAAVHIARQEEMNRILADGGDLLSADSARRLGNAEAIARQTEELREQTAAVRDNSASRASNILGPMGSRSGIANSDVNQEVTAALSSTGGHSLGSAPEGTERIIQNNIAGSSPYQRFRETAEHMAKRMREAAEAARQIRDHVRNAADQMRDRDQEVYGNALSQQISELQRRRSEIEARANTRGSSGPVADQIVYNPDAYALRNPDVFYRQGQMGQGGGALDPTVNAIDAASARELAELDRQIAELERQTTSFERLNYLQSQGVQLSEQELSELRGIHGAVLSSASAQQRSDMERIIAATNQRIADQLAEAIRQAQASVTPRPSAVNSGGQMTTAIPGGSPYSQLRLPTGVSSFGPAPYQGGGGVNYMGSFATGFDGKIHGRPGPDRNLIQMHVTSGERVTVTPAGKDGPSDKNRSQSPVFNIEFNLADGIADERGLIRSRSEIVGGIMAAANQAWHES